MERVFDTFTASEKKHFEKFYSVILLLKDDESPWAWVRAKSRKHDNVHLLATNKDFLLFDVSEDRREIILTEVISFGDIDRIKVQNQGTNFRKIWVKLKSGGSDLIKKIPVDMVEELESRWEASDSHSPNTQFDNKVEDGSSSDASAKVNKTSKTKHKKHGNVVREKVKDAKTALKSGFGLIVPAVSILILSSVGGPPGSMPPILSILFIIAPFVLGVLFILFRL